MPRNPITRSHNPSFPPLVAGDGASTSSGLGEGEEPSTDTVMAEASGAGLATPATASPGGSSGSNDAGTSSAALAGELSSIAGVRPIKLFITPYQGELPDRVISVVIRADA